MPSQHKNPELGWRPPAELSAWVRAEATRRRVTLKTILDAALTDYRNHHGHRTREDPTGPERTGEDTQEGTEPMAGASDYIDSSAQRPRLETVIARHAGPGGAIPASAVPGLTADLADLLDTVRSSGSEDGYEDAAQNRE